MRRARPWLAYLFASALCAPAFAATLTEVVSANRTSVIYIKVQKVVESTGAVTEQSGTGFVVNNDGFVITAHHVVGGGPGIQVDIMGATGSSAAQLEPMEVVAENSNFDVAILRFKNSASPRRPVELGDPWKLGAGDTIYALGYPNNEEWFHTDGKLAGRGQKGSWSTNAVLNPGMSGGPVFNTRGEVVAMVWGGVATPGIAGINRVLPVNLMSDMLKYAGAVARIQPADTPAIPIEGIEVAYRLDRTQESYNGVSPTTRTYSDRFQARPGYKIVDYTFVARSINHASTPNISVAPGGDVLSVSFDLTSGPVFDRWRGWMDGDIRTRQVPLAH